MRIGVVTTSYPRTPGEGAGGFVAGHVGALRALGHDVEVIAAGADGDPDEPGVHRVRDRALFYQGGAPDRLEQAPLGSAVAAASFTARLAAAVTRRARGWDAIIAHWLVPSALAALPARIPVTAIAHGGDVHTLRRLGLLGPVLRLLHARHARLAFVTAELRAIAAAADPRAATAAVQPMGLPLAHFAAIGRAPRSPPTILVAARLVPIKGVDVAIAALDRLPAGAHLVIAGDGPERARLPAHPRVTLLGQVDAAHRDRLLREASVVVVPSRVLPSGRSEGIPTIALEALATGVPVVASAVGGLHERAGIALVPPEDPDALARAIARVLADPPSPETLRATVTDLDWREVAHRLLRSE